MCCRRLFEQDIKHDLAIASELGPDCFQIKSVSPGGVIVGLEVWAHPSGKGQDPRAAVIELARQAEHPFSPLLTG